MCNLKLDVRLQHAYTYDDAGYRCDHYYSANKM